MVSALDLVKALVELLGDRSVERTHEFKSLTVKGANFGPIEINGTVVTRRALAK